MNGKAWVLDGNGPWPKDSHGMEHNKKGPEPDPKVQSLVQVELAEGAFDYKRLMKNLRTREVM